MECHICGKLVERHEFTRHVGSHPPSDVFAATGYDHYDAVLPVHSTSPRWRARTPLGRGQPRRPATPDDEPQSDDQEDVDIPTQHPTDNPRSTHLTSSHPPARTTPVPGSLPRQESPKRRPSQPNAFHLWLENPTHASPKYTTIDGQTDESGWPAQFTQAAEVLRCTTRNAIIDVVKGFKGLSPSDREACVELVRKAPIFPGLVAYTYTHLIMCPRRGWIPPFRDDWSGRVFELKQLVERWSKSGDIQCILSCDLIKNKLLQVLRVTDVRPEDHKCNLALLNGKEVVDFDVLNLAASVTLCVTGPQRKDILDQRGSQAEKLVELFHDLLEANVELDEQYRRCFLNPLIKFSKDCTYCPRGIRFKEGTIDTGSVSESQGGFGLVYKGEVGARVVAVKALKRGARVSLPEYNKQVSKEAIVWRHLRHPNCLPLYGVYRMPTDGPNDIVALVSPWMHLGTLFDYLERNPNASRTQLILDVVRGLNYLHSMQPHIAHRDIKPDNIFITRKGRACLADFGLASVFDADIHTAPSQVVLGGTYNYMAPEIFNAEAKEAKHELNKRACDIYALGCTIYATYTGVHPFDGMRPIVICANVTSGQRPRFLRGKVSPDMRSFVENLWGPDPSERLTATMALDWMEHKACQEGVDSSVAPLEEEWQWRGPRDDECLWSVSP